MIVSKKVFVIAGNHAGGLEHRIFQLFNHLQSIKREEWHLIASDKLLEKLTKTAVGPSMANILVYRQSKSGITTLGDAWRILKILRQSSFDVAILYEAIVKVGFIYWPFVKRVYISVVNPFDFLNENRSRLHVLGYLLSFRLYRDRIDALSPIIRDYLVGRMRFVRKVELAPITFAPLGEE
jgi:hypothetical protein